LDGLKKENPYTIKFSKKTSSEMGFILHFHKLKMPSWSKMNLYEHKIGEKIK